MSLIVPTIFIAPGVILGIRLAFVLPVIASERNSGFGALRQSNDLVRGRTIPVFIFLLGFGVFVLALCAPLPLVPSGPIRQIIVFAINSIFVAPLFIIFLQVLFEDLQRLTGMKNQILPGYFLHKLLVALGSIIFLLALFKAAF